MSTWASSPGWRILVLVATFCPATSAPCEDDAPDCPNWAKAGECEKNPAYMLQACRKSCGKCGRPASSSGKPSNTRPKAEAGANAEAGAGAASARTHSAEDVLGEQYTLHMGKLAGNGVLHTGRYDLIGARAWCDKKDVCAGFSTQVRAPAPAARAFSGSLLPLYTEHLEGFALWPPPPPWGSGGQYPQTVTHRPLRQRLCTSRLRVHAPHACRAVAGGVGTALHAAWHARASRVSHKSVGVAVPTHRCAPERRR